MNNPPLSQDGILECCAKPFGFSLLNTHPHFKNYTGKLEKLLNKNLIRLSKRLGDNGKVYELL
jgi:hypothetical protein